MKRALIAALPISVAGLSASAEYTITATSGGAGSVVVGTGLAFDVEVRVSSGGAEAHNSAIYRVVLSRPGVEYISYVWHDPYETGSIFDDSWPFIDALGSEMPLVLDALTLEGPGYPADVVDVELSNVVPSGTFGDGLLTTLRLRIPPGFPIGEPMTICIEPDLIADGFEPIAVEAGPPLEVVATLAGDFDGDLDVDVDDLIQIIVSWGPCPLPPPGSCPGDANGDGQVDFEDLMLLTVNWTS